MEFSPSDLTCDGFLGGRLSVWQPRTGYRAGIDPVLLAAAVPARAGACVLELGCGAGVASLCLGVRVPGLHLTGVEMQPSYAALARRNALEAGITLEVHNARLENMPAPLRQQSFDHVIANPPYFLRDRGTAAADAGRETALGEKTPLTVWIDVAVRRLAPKGRLTLIQRIGRLPTVLSALEGRLGSVEVVPLAPRDGRAPKLFLLRAVKGGRAAFVLYACETLHAKPRHEADEEAYTAPIGAILRNGAEFPWPGA